jgi:hypothetical protein
MPEIAPSSTFLMKFAFKSPDEVGGSTLPKMRLLKPKGTA